MVQLFDYTYMYCYGLTLNKFTYSDKIDQFRQNWFIWTDWIVIHRNHSFGFSFAETNWVSVSTETRFEFRSTETLTETHILVIFLSFLKNSEIFFTTLNTILLKNYWKNIEKSLVICCHSRFKMTSDMKNCQNMGFGLRSGFRFWFRLRRNFWLSVSV